MSDQWALCLSSAEKSLAARLRLMSGVEVCEDGDHIWLRGSQQDERSLEQLRLMPGGHRFLVLDDNQLVPYNARIPHGYLPKGPWQLLRTWCQLTLQPAAWPTQEELRSEIHFVRTDHVRPPTVLVTDHSTWMRYLPTAPQIRRAKWWFAVSDDDWVIVRGDPLPPLRGTQYVEHSGIAVPAGWHWSPPVDAQVLRDLLLLRERDFGLLHIDGSWECVLQENFVRATNSAVRQTWEARHGPRN